MTSTHRICYIAAAAAELLANAGKKAYPIIIRAKHKKMRPDIPNQADDRIARAEERIAAAEERIAALEAQLTIKDEALQSKDKLLQAQNQALQVKEC